MRTKPWKLIVVPIAALLLGLTVAAGLALGGEASPAAATVYVRTDGDDTNCDGTADAAYPGGGPGLPCAFATIGKGINFVDDGGAVFVGPGTFTGNFTLNTRDLTLQGAGPGGTIVDGGGTNRVFNVGFGYTVEIAGVTIRNGSSSSGSGISNSGDLHLSNTVVTSNTATSNGGGITNWGAITLTNSHVVSNTAGTSAGGLYNEGALVLQGSSVSANTAGASGGGIHNEGGTALIAGSEIISNTAAGGGRGGGIWSSSGPLTMTDSVVLSNTAEWMGGGIAHDDVASLTRVTIAGNTASDDGGGICVEDGGTLALADSTVSGNTTPEYGGGISVFTANSGARSAAISNSTIRDNTSAKRGGGIFSAYTTTLTASTVSGNRADTGGGIRSHGPLTITNSTISGNEAAADGGGLLPYFNVASLVNVTVVSNTADSDGNGSGDGGGIFRWNTTYLVNTLVAYNTDGGDETPDCYGTLDSLGYNLIGDATGCTIGGSLTGVISNTDPLVGPLQDNGGPTPTHALLEGSPAINVGSDAACPAVDQRGLLRVGGCDVGAYERNLPVYLPVVLRSY